MHGGSGYMRDYVCERLYRDARITSIYEGTTQLQVVAAIRYATSGFYAQLLDEYLTQPQVQPQTEFSPIYRHKKARPGNTYTGTSVQNRSNIV